MPASKAKAAATDDAAALIAAKIAALPDWRGATLARLRALVLQALPDAVEEWKWRTPVWSASGGIVCTGEVYKQVVKLTFPKGAALPDPAGLFNSSLEGNVRRTIDVAEDAPVNEAALKALLRAAAAANAANAKAKPPGRTRPTTKTTPPKLLAGGNPQIAKADGDAPVQAYIAAIPGWKQDVARRLDALITRTVPDANKAIRWNSPFYGMPGQGWFLSFHCFTHYVKLGFFRGAQLQPPPPGVSKQDEVRYLDIHEHDPLDEAQLAAWVQQASRLPGWGKS